MGLTRSIKRAAVLAGRLAPRTNPATRRVVLCYHSVHPKRPFHSTTPAAFDHHLRWLTERCHVTTLVDLVRKRGQQSDGKPTVAITFDDGYEDNHSYALPILSRYHAPATFFVTAGFLERDPMVMARFQRLLGCDAGDLVPLHWQQVRELRDSGMDIGCHTYSHPNLARLPKHHAAAEVQRSRSVIADRIGSPVDLFAYPFGKPRVHFTAQTVDEVRAAGFQMAAAVTFRGVRESDPLFSIPRVFADGDSIAKLDAKITGAYELVGWWQDHAPLSLMRMISPLDFER